MRPLLPSAALLATVGFLAIACSDGPPTSVPEVSPPTFKPGQGKGKPQPDPSITVQFDDAGNTIRSDGGGIYDDGVCNVDATFNLEDARLHLKGRIKKKDQKTCGDPRRFLVDFTDRVAGSPPSPEDGNVGVEGTFAIVDFVEMVTEADGTVSRTASFQMPGCGQTLRFSSIQSTTDFTVNNVDVNQNTDGTWTVKTQPSPNDVAVCIPGMPGEERSYYHMPFEITVTLK